MARIVPVNPERIDLAWGTVEPWLVAAMKHGPALYAPEDVKAACAARDMILWVAIVDEKIVGMTVTSLEKYPRAMLLVVRWAAGSLGRGRAWIKDMVDELDRWAVKLGAVEIVATGRI